MSEAATSKVTAVEYDPFAATAVARVVPTTEAQREMWLADRLSREASLAYNESVTLRMEGELSVQALQQALNELANRHEALRSVLSEDGLSMMVAPEGTLPLSEVDLSGRAAGEQSAEIARLRALAVETPFDLINGPLVRAVLVRLGATTHELIVTGHHIVCDGWSFGVLSREIMALYQAAHSGIGAGVLPEADKFGDYALAQLDAAHAADAATALRYWTTQFDGSVPTLDLPTDRPRAPLRTFSSRRLDVPVEPALLDAVRKLGAKNGTSLFATLFSFFSATIARLAGNEDVVIGVPAAGQSAEGLETLVGHCVNLLPIRVAVDFEQDVASLLKSTRKRVLDGYDHQSCTFGTLLGKLNIGRDPSRLPLVSVLFNLDSAIDPVSLSLGGLQVHLHSNPRHFENFEIFLNASQVDGGLLLECQYNTDLFDEATVSRWLTLFRTALERATGNPAQPLASLLAPTEADLALLARFNRSELPYPRTTRVEAQIARQVSATPDAIAVSSGDRKLSYRELDQRANALAARLRASGVGPGQLVGLFCGRNEHMIVGLYGILKSGAGYVPLDPSFPADRLQFMAEDGGLRFIVSEASVRDAWKFSAAERVAADESVSEVTPVAPAGTHDDIAYVIYTSGSTGKPKGVRVPHCTVSNLLASVQREPGMTAAHRVLSVTTLSFDIAVSEVIAPLTVGARIVIADKSQTTDGERLRDLIESEGVDFIDATPSTWRLLLAAGWRGSKSIRAICTGEPLPPDLGTALIPLVGELWNGYGPTETTVWSSFHRVTKIDGPVPIGHPVANTQIHVVDNKLRTLPVGVIGELFIGGEGVTQGYLARPELTAERFLPDPHRAAEGGRWYKTGDLGRWRADGVLECLGRSDHQIKLRGYRIELGEIEANLVTHESVARAIVITREDQPGDVRLVAYIVPKGEMNADALREHLRRNLPEYMLPQHFIALQAVPLLPNGKLDRRGLPKPDIESLGGGRARVSPRTPLEAEVLGAMEQVLNLPGLGVTDNFFSLGGHSLLAAKLTARVNKDFDVNLPLRTVFESPTAAALASAIEAGKRSTAPKRAQVKAQADQSAAPLTVMQERIRFVEEMFPGRVTYNTPSAHRLRGRMDVAAFGRAFNEVVRRQPGLRTFIARQGEAWLQRVQPELSVAIPFEDLAGLPAEQREAELMKRLRALIDQPMDIYTPPLFRTALFRLDADYHVFFFMPHHIIWDGWSFDVLYQEMAAAYPAALQAKNSPLAPLSVTYTDYAQWHANWLKGDDFNTQLAFWKKRFAAIETPLSLPTDHPRRAGMTGTGEVEWVHIDKPLAQGLHEVARKSDATINMLAMALYAGLLSEAVGGHSVIVGMPVRGRLMGEVEPIMGFFNNMLPIHFQVDPDLSLPQWVAAVKRELIDTFANQDVPFERLAAEPEFTAYSQKVGFYQGLFSFQDARERQRDWGGLAQENLPVMQGGATEDFGLWLMEGPSGLTGGINFNADLFTRETARLFRRRLLKLFNDAVANPEASLRVLLEQPGEEQRELRAWLDARRAEAARPLPAATPIAAVATNSNSSPQTPAQAALAQLWSDLLGMDASQIQHTDNFFDLGGSSLLAMQAVAEMEKRLALKVDPRRYVYESLSQLAGGAPASASSVGAASSTHGALAGIWAELLGLEATQIQPTDNFFDLGGSSLLAMRAVAEGEKRLGVRIDPRRYVYESLQQLASSPKTEAVPPVVETRQAAPVLSRLFGRFGKKS